MTVAAGLTTCPVCSTSVTCIGDAAGTTLVGTCPACKSSVSLANIQHTAPFRQPGIAPTLPGVFADGIAANSHADEPQSMVPPQAEAVAPAAPSADSHSFESPPAPVVSAVETIIDEIATVVAPVIERDIASVVAHAWSELGKEFHG